MKKSILLIALTLLPISPAFANEQSALPQTNTNLSINKNAVYIAPKLAIGLQNTTVAIVVSSLNQFYSGTDEKISGGTFAGGLGIGYDFSKTSSRPIRIEAELLLSTSTKINETFSYPDYPVEVEIKHSVHTLYLNYYYDFKNETNTITPYISGGLGLGFSTLDVPMTITSNGASMTIDDVRKKTSPFIAVNIGAGLGYPINDKMTFDCAYRLGFTGGAKTKEFEGEYLGQIRATLINQLVAGLRYSF